MPPTALESPLLKALLRGLILVAATEAVFFRLMPEPPRAMGRPFARALAHAAEAGQVAWIIALTIVTIALLGVALTSLRRSVWPPFRNGVVAACMLALAAQGVSLLTARPGAATAIAFTLLSLLTYLLMATHAYARAGSVWARGFMVAYGAALIVSVAGGVVHLTSSAHGAMNSGTMDALLDMVPHAFQGGGLLAAAAASFAFLAFGEDASTGAAARSGRWPILALCASVAASFAAGCLLAPPDASILGEEASTLQVLALTCALFLGLLTAARNLIRPESRTRGYGLLLMLMAGYPLGIAYEHMLMVLGSALLLSPAAAGRHGAIRSGGTPGLEATGGASLPPDRAAFVPPAPYLTGD